MCRFMPLRLMSILLVKKVEIRILVVALFATLFRAWF
jgi:hypothetical protein